MHSLLYGEMLIWISGFGFSDILCDQFKIKTKLERVIYYTICLIIGLLFSNLL